MDSSGSLIFNLGNSIEYHPIEQRVSPYIGGLLNIGILSYKNEIDSDNWTKVVSIPLSIGPILGLEISVLKFLSLFAEYGLTVNFTSTSTKQSTAGVVTKDSDTDLGIEAGIGNDSKIGIILYFSQLRLKKNKSDISEKKKKDK